MQQLGTWQHGRMSYAFGCASFKISGYLSAITQHGTQVSWGPSMSLATRYSHHSCDGCPGAVPTGFWVKSHSNFCWPQPWHFERHIIWHIVRGEWLEDEALEW